MCVPKNVECITNTQMARMPVGLIDFIDEKVKEKQLEYDSKNINKKVTRTAMSVEVMDFIKIEFSFNR